MALGLEWTGKSFSDKIDDLKKALDATETFLRKADYEPDTLYRMVLIEAENNNQIGPATSAWLKAELFFSELAFSNWHTIPDNWSLTANPGIE